MNKQKNKFIKYYYDFFDKKLSDSSIVVLIIWAMIFIAGYIIPTNTIYAKSNLLESNYIVLNDYENIIVIWWKKYKVILQNIK